MAQQMESHHVRIARQRAAYHQAHERFVKRLREAPADAAERAPANGGWSAAQIGWHVATVDATFAGLLSGTLPGAQPVPDGATIKDWAESRDARRGARRSGGNAWRGLRGHASGDRDGQPRADRRLGGGAHDPPQRAGQTDARLLVVTPSAACPSGGAPRGVERPFEHQPHIVDSQVRFDVEAVHVE